MRNKFGVGEVTAINGLKGNNYIISCGCLNTYAEALSWANANIVSTASTTFLADNIIIQGCQRTDLAVLEAFKQIEYCAKQYPTKQIYLSGCLAKRFDIPVLAGVKRLVPLYKDNQYIRYFHLVQRENQQLNWNQLFSGYYPVRIGRGGSRYRGQCNGATIRPGLCKIDSNYYNRVGLEREMRETDKPTVLVSDKPTVDQLNRWLGTAIFSDVPIALSNVEADDCILPFIEEVLLSAARCKVLSGIHCRLRSTHPKILSHYDYNVSKIERFLSLVRKLKKLGVFCAADVVINFKGIKDPGMRRIKSLFDVVRWEPYWDGKWDRRKAENRSEIYNQSNFDWTFF